MNKYSTQATQSTASNVILGSLMAALMMPVNLEKNATPLIKKSYVQLSKSDSFQRIDGLSTYKTQSVDLDLLNTVKTVYSKLLSSQEVLGDEFSKILHENLWDLYES